ncbi:MAG: glycolate oxidase binding subunit, partial [Acidimicrobiaceae bacterium]|nr:glycolate oxidase binding subunit [Acidimicrobiaceae bacterium]
GVRQVRAPAGIVAYEPAEMTVRVRAGTVVAELDEALAAHGQMVVLDPAVPGAATVGGVLAAGESGLRRLRYGPVRDTLLEARFVSAEGRMVKAGGPVVKNVSGFDLCRLLVGSRGTLGVLAEVVLRLQPRPAVSRWLMGAADPFAVRRRLYRPSSVLWDGEITWVLLEGHPSDVSAEASALGRGFVDAVGPPPRPAHRWSMRPSALPALAASASDGAFVAEVGVGTVHRDRPQPVRPVDPLHERVRALFDPGRRFAAA